MKLVFSSVVEEFLYRLPSPKHSHCLQTRKLGKPRAHCPRISPPFDSSSCSFIIRSHQLIVLHPARKLLLPHRRRMCPWLQPILLPDRSRKARRPLLPRIVLHHIFNRLLVNKFCVAAHIVCSKSWCQSDSSRSAGIETHRRSLPIVSAIRRWKSSRFLQGLDVV